MPGPVRRVVIVGGGAAGWMAASALAKVFGSLIRIELVESDEIGIVGVGEATIPQIKLFNGLLGLDEKDFLRRTQGTIKLGIQFVDWKRRGHSYLHAFGQFGRNVGGLSFHQYWLKARKSEQAEDLWAYSLNAEAAERGLFGHGADLAYAYHFDAGLYARFLRDYAEALGVVRTEGKVADVLRRPDTGDIAAIRMERGGEIAGDLFIDCTGFRGLLIEQTLETGYDDWSEWLPCDRAMAVPSQNVGSPHPYTRSTARDAGWQWRIPLQHRTGNGYVYCSRFISDDEAVSTLKTHVEGELLAEPRPLRFVTGVRRKLWNRNCVALGLASGFMEPLESTSIHLIQADVDKLIRFFPTEGIQAADVAEFNRQSRAEFEAVRDFLVLHYAQVERDDTPFWRHCRTEIRRPDSLLEKQALFAANGRIRQDEFDLFTESSWLQVLYGQGLSPAGYDRLADRLSDSQLAQLMGDTRRMVKGAADAMTTHKSFLAALAPSEVST
ncbi:tryptophan halogenase family protein [Brevundimonas sp.]|uniref:tryptophan halogenase family protein n=1 Tax=Brevundimonas sp. TaxID=1871086 RepID=UPI0025DF4BDB|nr:tryptophan halogenase family protein [Brevundimonas sp.]